MLIQDVCLGQIVHIAGNAGFFYKIPLQYIGVPLVVSKVDRTSGHEAVYVVDDVLNVSSTSGFWINPDALTLQNLGPQAPPQPTTKFQSGDKVQLKSAFASSYPSGYGGAMEVDYMSNGVVYCILPNIGMVRIPEYQLEMVPLKIPQPPLAGLNAWLPLPTPNILPSLKSLTGDKYDLVMSSPPPHKKCECGAESLGYMTHSPWCQKHER